MRKSIGRGGRGKLNQFKPQLQKNNNKSCGNDTSRQNDRKINAKKDESWRKVQDKVYKKSQPDKVSLLSSDLFSSFIPSIRYTYSSGDYDFCDSYAYYYNRIYYSNTEDGVVVNRGGKNDIRLGRLLGEELQGEDKKAEKDEKKENPTLFPHEWIEKERHLVDTSESKTTTESKEKKKIVKTQFQKRKIRRELPTVKVENVDSNKVTKGARTCKIKLMFLDKDTITSRVYGLLKLDECEEILRNVRFLHPGFYASAAAGNKYEITSEPLELELNSNYGEITYQIKHICRFFFFQTGEEYGGRLEIKLMNFEKIKTLIIQKLHTFHGTGDNKDWNMVMIQLEDSDNHHSLKSRAGDATWISSTSCKLYSKCLEEDNNKINVPWIYGKR